MTNRVVHSRRSFVVFITILLWMTGCSDDPASSPEEVTPEDYTLQGTDTIGSNGGVVEASGFVLTVPAGAFDGDYELKLYASVVDRAFGDNGVTKTYRIDGFPRAYSQPLRIAIEYDGALTEGNLVGFGEWAKNGLSGDSTVVYGLESATDSSGFLVAELPVPGDGVTTQPSGLHRSPENADDDEGQMHLAGTTGYGASETAHFIVLFPVYLDPLVGELSEMLEDAYEIVADSNVINGIGFSHDSSLSWPLRVVVAPGLPGDWANFFEGDLAFAEQINVNSARLNPGDLPRLEIEIGGAVLHSALLGYDSELTFYLPAHLWLGAAVMTWSEERFSGLGYEYPVDFHGYVKSPFNGLRAGADSGAVSHGIGMAAMIQYLVDTSIYGRRGLVGTFDMIGDYDNPVDPTAALLNNVNGLVADWWPDFFRKYVGGEIYGVSSAAFTNWPNLSGVWNVDDDGDTLKVFSPTDPAVGLYPDLSAKLFVINLGHDTIDASARMTLSVSGEVGHEPVTMSVFGIQGDPFGPLVYLGHTSVQSEVFLIEGLRGYIDDGWRLFLVVVVNSDHDASSYTGKSDIDFQIRVGIPSEVWQPNRCIVSATVLAHWRDVSTEHGTSEYDEHWPVSSNVAEGVFSGNTFAGSYSVDNPPYETRNGTVTATFNENLDTLIAVNWSETLHMEWAGVVDASTSLVGTNIPLGLDYPTSRHYVSLEEEACNHISSLTYHSTRVGVLVRDLLDHTCNGQSEVRIYFYEE